MNEKYVAAIDFGSCKVIGAIARKCDEGIEIIDIEVEKCEGGCLDKGEVKSVDTVAMQVNRIVQKLKNASGIKEINYIYLNWQNINSNEEAKEKILKRLIKSVMVIYPDESTPELLKEILTTEKERSTGVLLIDFGDTFTTYTFIDNNEIKLSSSLPGGSRLITSDLESLFQYDYNLAERLKLTFGKAMPTEGPDKIIQLGSDGSKNVRVSELSKYIMQRVDDIFNRIIAKMTKMQWNSNEERLIVLAGGGSLLPYLDVLLKRRTGLTVRTARNTTIKFIGDKAQTIQTPEYATILALINHADKPCDSEKPSKRTMTSKLRTLFTVKGSQEKSETPNLFTVCEKNETM